jgi:ubiquinone/menaquinone biosynthesis C-methylase UbiE
MKPRSKTRYQGRDQALFPRLERLDSRITPDRTTALQDDARRWQLDLDAARYYQQFLVPVVLQPWATQLVDRATLSPGCRVLDLACGTGLAARIAAERVGPGGEVVGIDLNLAMLSVARSLKPVPGARIRWRWGDAEDLPFLGLPFDAVLCHQGFQFFPDRVKAALEIARVLRPGGLLALSVWSGPDRNPLAAALIDVLQNRRHPAFSRAMRWPFSVQSRREIAAPITRAGFRVLTSELSRLRVCAVNATAFIHGFLRAMPFAGEIHAPEMEALVRDTVSGLRGYVDQGELRVPSQAHIILAVRAAELCDQDRRSSK